MDETNINRFVDHPRVILNVVTFMLYPAIGTYGEDYMMEFLEVDNDNNYKTMTLEKDEILFHLTFDHKNNPEKGICSYNWVIRQIRKFTKYQELKEQVYELTIEVGGPNQKIKI